MAQAELTKLLYGALSSGSGVSDNDNETAITAALMTQADVDAIIGFSEPTSFQTPAEIIAHYDFRVRS